MTAQSALPPSLAAKSERPALQKVSVEEYLEQERCSEVRHEYVEGEILAMAGETPAHNRIARNTCVHLQNAFGERPCESFIENIKVRDTYSERTDVLTFASLGESLSLADIYRKVTFATPAETSAQPSS